MTMGISKCVVFVVYIFTIILIVNSVKARRKRCPPLPFTTVENGRIWKSEKYLFKVKCDAGYLLAGDNFIRCYDGSWTTMNRPLCLENEGLCESPPPIPNGEIHGDDRKEGSTILYICKEGHILLGDSMRTCTTGYWSGITPTCMHKSEPIENIATRLRGEFLEKMGSHSSDSLISARYLDTEALVKGLELVIVVDRSSSVDPFDLEYAKKFIQFLSTQFGVKNGHNPNGARMAVIAFGTEINVIFNVNTNNITGPDAVEEELTKLQAGGGGTAMAHAFVTVVTEVVDHLDRGAKRALFLMSDGEPNIDDGDTTAEDMAEDLKENYNFEIFTVGIGKEVNSRFLSTLASQPILSHVFMLEKYPQFMDIIDIVVNRPTEEPVLGPEKCGHVDENDPYKSWPWTAMVYVSFSEGEEENKTTKLNLCSGVLICSKWVLTAASCFYHSVDKRVSLNLQETFVVLGEKSLVMDDESQRNYYAKDVIIHHGHSFGKVIDNLALIELNEAAPVDVFRPVCLPPVDRTVPLHLDSAANVSVVGFGVSTANDMSDIGASNTRFEMMTKTVVVSEERACDRVLRRAAEMSIFCIETGIVTPCLANMGSPVVAQDSVTGINHIVGLLSQRSKCGKGYSLYTELRKYIKWINDVTEKCHYFHWN